MAKLVFGMNLSFDRCVDQQRFVPGPALSRPSMTRVGNQARLYGRRMYGEMVKQASDNAQGLAVGGQA